MAIYLTGASGNLGKEVLGLLPAAIPIVRKASGLKNEKVADFSDAAGLKRALSDCDTLVHLAGSMKFYDNKAMEAGNVILTRNLLAALPSKAKVIYASSISVYGKNISGKVDERTAPNPDSVYAKTKYEAEKMVMARKGSVALRIGPIYGPQFADYAKFLRMIRKGRMVIFGNGKNLVSFVHVSDVARAVKAALSAEPGIYVVSGPSETQERIYALAAKELGVSAPGARIPLKAALLFAHAEEMLAKLTGKKPLITREHVNILGKSREFDFSKAKKGLKFTPRPIADGIREIARAGI